MAEAGVEVVWGALNNAWRKAGYTELWVQFRPRGVKDVFDSVDEAIGVADQVVEDAGWGDDVHTSGGVSDSDAGPVVFLRRAGHEPGLRSWLGAFAKHLESLGNAGTVTAAPEAYFPGWAGGDVDSARHLTAFVSYRANDLTQMGEMARRGGWHVPAALTQRIAEAGAAWGRFSGADVYLRRHLHQIRTKNPDVGRPLADAVIRSGMASVAYLRSDPRRVVSMSFSTQGSVFYQVQDDTVSWQDRLEQVTAAMVAFPQDTDLAFLRYNWTPTTSWSALATARPPLPHVKERHIRYNKHLHSQYTPDAHGLQLLTEAHLGHAHDLSDWVLVPLGGGRHLVQANDLEPWYASPDTDPATLAKARADFGSMILTEQTIEDNPPPWY
jgi:hypothetical protein